MNKHDFIFDYEFKLFEYPRFEHEGTSDGEGCDLFIIDMEKNNKVINIRYDKDEISLIIDDVFIIKFDFCENFEEIIFNYYQSLLKML